MPGASQGPWRSQCRNACGREIAAPLEIEQRQDALEEQLAVAERLDRIEHILASDPSVRARLGIDLSPAGLAETGEAQEPFRSRERQK